MLVYVRGAGDIATGVAARLVRAGVSVVMADIAVPTCIRRTISFCEAIRLGEVEIEGIRARLAQTSAEALEITEAGDVAVVVDPQAQMLDELKPAAVVDAILAKRNLGTTRDMAPAVIAVGPGFTAPVDCDAVVETMRGHFLGRVITQGSPQPNTGVPGVIAGYGRERVIHSPAAGVFRSDRAIGDIVSAEMCIRDRCIGCQDLVRFFALLRIKPHTPLLVRAPVNSFEFQPCGRTPQVEYLLC